MCSNIRECTVIKKKMIYILTSYFLYHISYDFKSAVLTCGFLLQARGFPHLQYITRHTRGRQYMMHLVPRSVLDVSQWS